MITEDIAGRLAFIRSAEQLKNVLRSSYTSKGRHESTPEHTWRLCLLAMAFQDKLAHLNFERVLKICVIHDLGEAINGDTPAVAQTAGSEKSIAEREDLQSLLEPLPFHLQSEILTLWDEYESGGSPEALAVKALDKIETILQHNQGMNPEDFDYEFNLYYGSKYTERDPLFSEIRAILDEETRGRIRCTASSRIAPSS